MVPKPGELFFFFLRLGWLPSDFLLAFHGLRWYLRIFHAVACPSGSFAQKARKFLSHLESISGSNLSSTEIISNSDPIRGAMFLDLRRC